MTAYEHVKGSKVTERVQTADGSLEDIRLAEATKDGKSGWRVAKSTDDTKAEG